MLELYMEGKKAVQNHIYFFCCLVVYVRMCVGAHKCVHVHTQSQWDLGAHRLG